MTAAAPAGLAVTTGDFLHALYPDGINGAISLLLRDTTAGRPRAAWATTIDEIRTIARHNRDAGDIWFGPAPRHQVLDKGRGGIDACANLPALWVDIDISGPGHANTERLPPTLDAAHTLLAAMPIPPSITVHSGGGLQAWWLLAEPLDPAPAVELLAAWGGTWATLADRHGWAIDNVFNLDRVMRLPNTRNHKLEQPRPVPIIDWHPDRRFGRDDIEQFLLDPPTPPDPTPRSTTGSAVPYIGPSRPGDHFNALVTPQQVLQRAGWSFGHRDRNGDEHWTRPGKDPRQGTSATIYAVDGHTTIWSDAPTLPPGLETRRPYDPFGLHVAINHAGDHRGAAIELTNYGFGTRAVGDDDLLGWVARQPPLTTPGLEEEEAPASPSALCYPDELWHRHPALPIIRDAARARMVAPDAVLAAVLCRVAVAAGHQLDLPGTIGAPMGLTMYAGLVGPPEAGKSAAAAVAAELLPAPTGVLDRLPIGSGEGMVDVLFEMKTETDADGKKVRRKRQTKNQAIFHIDEGAVLADLASRSGSTLLATMRTAYTHGTLGNTNASEERKRILDGRSYVYGITMGIQPDLAAPLLADRDAGTPQRFIWATAIDPTAPTEAPPWPGELAWSPPSRSDLEHHEISRGGWRRHQLTLDPTITAQVRAERLAKLRGETTVASIDAHATLVRLKVAAALALLDRTLDISAAHWETAGMICSTSHQVRDAIAATIAATETLRRTQARDLRAGDEIHVETAREQRLALQGARSAARTVHRHAEAGEHDDPQGCAKRCIHAALNAKTKREVGTEGVIAAALERGWIRCVADRFVAGESRPA